MSEPTFAPRLAGDVTDDDGQVIDSLFVETDAPPALPVTVGTHTATDKPKPVTRLITRTDTFLNTWTDNPVPLLPADLGRKEIHITVASTAGTETILIADDPGKLQGGGIGAAKFYAAAQGNERAIVGHTGPLWALASTSNTGTVTVSIVAVSE